MKPSRKSLVALGVAGLVAAAMLAPATAPGGSAASANRAGIVVRFGDGEVRHQCVGFGEQQITGWDLLRRSRFEVVSRQFGSRPAICMLDGQGCSADDCWCEYPTFWGYWTREPTAGDWTFSSAGSSDRTVRNGSMDGWSWGANGMPAPPRLPFGEVCPAAAPAPTVTTPPTVPPTDRGDPPLPSASPAPAPATSPAPSPGVAGAVVTPSPSPDRVTPTPSRRTGSPAPAARPAQTRESESSGAGYLAFAAFVAAMVAAGAAAAFTRRRSR